MKYSISRANPSQHIFNVRTEIECEPGAVFRLELSRWRPGRYENAAYPPKISDARAFESNGKPVPYTRLSAHSWDIGPVPTGKAYFEHCFYAAEKNAGSSFLDNSLVYINPINLLLFNPQKINEECELILDIPESYQLATSLKRKEQCLVAKNFHELADSPILASENLLHYEYQVNSIPFHLWFWGDVKIDSEKVISEFTRFTEAQLKLFGGFPADEYHFLFLVLPVLYHHGVEHHASTVIVMGPGYNLMDGTRYDDFLGISSHELFHTWNVKAIRPAEMQPYDYTRETYSFQHYITEGVTTYYGDQILLRCGVWDLNTFLKEFHDSNPGRHYVTDGGKTVSLRQASFESWINGYQEGVPNKKISFYSKGAMVAFMLDQELLERSANKYSLDHVMREMYERFGKTCKGYTEEDFWNIAESFCGGPLTAFREKYIDGTVSLESGMRSAAERIGFCWTNDAKAYQFTLGQFGLTWQSVAGRCIVTNVMPQSPAEAAGLAKDDEIIALGGRKIENNLNEVAGFLRENTEIEIHFFSVQKLRSGMLSIKNPPDSVLFTMKALQEPDEKQKTNFAVWIKGIA